MTRRPWDARSIVAAAGLLGLAAAACAGGPGGGSARDADRADSLAPGRCVRPVLVGEATNARDIGDHAVGGGKLVPCRRFLRGGDLSGLGAAGCAELAEIGVRTVIDLRMDGTVAEAPPAACVTERAEVVRAPMPKLLPPTRETYLALLEEREAVATAFSTLADAEAYPVYVHCVIGRDRASFATALVLLAAGASRQTVVDEFLLSEDAGVDVEAEWIEAVLDELDERGGAEAYLRSAGVSETDLDALRVNLLADPG